MKRSYFVIAISLIAIGILFDWRLSQAVDTEQPASATAAIATSETEELRSRIELLEKRVASLERTGSSVRQANSRSSEFEQPLLTTQPAQTQSEANRRNDEDVPAQRINGQTWRFRLLGNSNSESQRSR